jgi:transposase InsO family protein
MKAMAHERRRFGYRRLHVLLRREGYVVNHSTHPVRDAADHQP